MNQRRIKTLVNNLQTATVQELFEVVSQIKGNESFLFVTALVNTMRDAIHQQRKYKIELSIKEKPDTRKIPIIKTIREITNLGLKEAKYIMDRSCAGPAVITSASGIDAIYNEAEAKSVKREIESSSPNVTATIIPV